jgi:phosphoenolpyruvate carboxykinase (ATP)
MDINQNVKLMKRLAFKAKTHIQLPVAELVKQTLARGEGVLNDTGALVVKTGAFTGRSPLDKFIVRDSMAETAVDWNKFNTPIEEKYFFGLKDKMLAYLNEQPEIWQRDAYACADAKYRMNVRVINENPWCNHFVANMFLNPTAQELSDFEPEWLIIQAPGFFADPATDGTRKGNFTILSFTYKTILIGGSGYTGEIKKGIFTALNFILPFQKKVLSMHCSANEGANGDTAVFFGLSGTGKTTLSSDAGRKLIGDDEHGWNDKGIFNFEGGCYAKIINLSAEFEPEIYQAIRDGALVENSAFVRGTNKIDFADRSLTENTRVSYPIDYIPNAKLPSVTGLPKNIFFLTCDAYGVLPPISKLTKDQAMYHFLSGYTAKIAGTEEGVTEPQVTFSTCFGAPFLPLNPRAYADLLGEKLERHNVKVWLVNTGWTGGAYGTGSRMAIKHTRAMVNAALNGDLDKVTYNQHPVFGLSVPTHCVGVPDEVLNPRDTWADKNAYDETAHKLAEKFDKNYAQYKQRAVA